VNKIIASGEQTIGLVARLAGAQPAHPSSSPKLGSGAQEFSSIKKYQQVLVLGLVFFLTSTWTTSYMDETERS
jgi:hypothetical protein